jgi:hypothetical protein
MNPYDIPKRPRVTIRQILPWILQREIVSCSDLVEEFGVTSVDAGVRLLKLHRWGYLRRKKAETPPRVYGYTVTRFGKKAVKRWAK